MALFVSILVYACVDRGQLFAYFGWVHPRRRIFWLYALVAGAAAAALVVAILHAEHTPLCHTSPATLLYGVTIGPIIEEILFRGAAFSVIYVTAARSRRFSASGSRSRLSYLPCSLRSLTPERWEFRGCVLRNGNAVRDDALAIQFNCGGSSHARYVQRSDCVGHALRLVRFDRVSNLLYTFLTHFQQPRQRGR